MTHSEITSRIAALVVALIAWAGLVVQGIASYHLVGSVGLALWTMLAYFTIVTNVLVAIVFTAVVLRPRNALPVWILAGTMLSILLVGIVYRLLLHGLVELSGGSAIANVLLHAATPILVTIFWLLFVPKGSLTWRHPLLWAIFPLSYLPYALLRGAATGRYAYPFIDVTSLGWQQTIFNVVAISGGFMLCGFAVVWLDRHLPASSAT